MGVFGFGPVSESVSDLGPKAEEKRLKFYTQALPQDLPEIIDLIGDQDWLRANKLELGLQWYKANSEETYKSGNLLIKVLGDWGPESRTLVLFFRTFEGGQVQIQDLLLASEGERAAEVVAYEAEKSRLKMEKRAATLYQVLKELFQRAKEEKVLSSSKRKKHFVRTPPSGSSHAENWKAVLALREKINFVIDLLPKKEVELREITPAEREILASRQFGGIEFSPEGFVAGMEEGIGMNAEFILCPFCKGGEAQFGGGYTRHADVSFSEALERPNWNLKGEWIPHTRWDCHNCGAGSPLSGKTEYQNQFNLPQEFYLASLGWILTKTLDGSKNPLDKGKRFQLRPMWSDMSQEDRDSIDSLEGYRIQR